MPRLAGLMVSKHALRGFLQKSPKNPKTLLFWDWIYYEAPCCHCEEPATKQSIGGWSHQKLELLADSRYDTDAHFVEGRLMLKYDEFIEKVSEAGFWTPLTNYIDPGIFVYGAETAQCYTGDPETDTTIWPARAAQEKKLAYGYFFNGRPGGYIAPRFYPIFIDAFRPRMTVEERHDSGKFGEYEWKVWNVFHELGGPLSWSQLWQYYRMKDAAERRKLDAALKNLQMTFDIAVSGNLTNVLKNGEPAAYKDGSPITGIGYDKVDNWVPPEWLAMNPRMERREALEAIYRQAEKISSAGDAQKAFRKSLALCRAF